MCSDIHTRHARRLGLVLTAPDRLTITRVGDVDSGFTYQRVNGRGPVPMRRCRAIDGLALPPAWTEVRIAARDNAHLQAIGRDAAGRLQYRYHERWTQVREAVKARRLLRFGKALPRIRAAVAAAMKGPADARDTVIATAVDLIDKGHLRIGSERYAAHGTRGATTLMGRHVRIEKGEVRLAFRAKSGKAARLSFRDRRLARKVAALKARPGRLFTFRDADGSWRAVGARHVNDWLSDIAGMPVSAKDFRTFAGSAIALEALDEADDAPLRNRVPAAMRAVAERLRNTPAVARASYVLPEVLEAEESDPDIRRRALRGRRRKGLSRAETALMRILEAR